MSGDPERPVLPFRRDTDDERQPRHWIHLGCGGRVVVDRAVDTPNGTVDLLVCRQCRRWLAWS